jgi:lipoprotein-anchoring transpeptidase ErfK/SrfK
VDAAKHTFTPTVSGKAIGVWPTSLGRPEFATRNGTYVVLSKDPSLRMTSCSAQITCDKTNPNYYDLTVNWDVRLTWSGTFVHSAPWSVDNQGFANVSHGCVNLSQAHGQAFFELSRYGDVVVVKNSSRPATDLVQSGDPGMADWNMSWSAYVAASALKQPVTTTPLPTQQG